MTVSEYIFDFLAKKGCDRAFMVSGSSAMFLTDALKRNTAITPICNHHEQAAAMSADIYGRLHGIPGICLVTIGPGATNAITGVAQAYLDSSPMIVLSGQASSKLLRYEVDTGIRQHGTQSLNLEPMVSSITKYFAAVTDIDTIKYHLERAYYEAISNRKGPVWLDIPIDIQNKQIGDMIGFTQPKEIDKIPDDFIANATEMIKSAKKPMILSGYGVRNANAVDLLRQFSQKCNIPIVTSRGGIDTSANDDLFVGRPGSYGDRASHFAIQECDLLLVLGSRLSVATIGYYPKDFAQKAKKIMVDIDTKELCKDDVPIDYKINGDVKEFLERIIKAVPNMKHTEWAEHCQKLKQTYPVVLPEYKEEDTINPYYFTDCLSRYLPNNSILLVDTGSVCNIVSQSITLQPQQRYLISGGLSCMGFWAGAIGAVGQENPIVALTGDGSAQMNIQELATIAYNKIPIKLFIYHNNGYMLIRHNQHNYMDDRFLGVGSDSGLQTPDFCKIAQAYGIKSVEIHDKEEIDAKLQEVFSANEPVVCQVKLKQFSDIAPRIASRVMPDGSLKAAAFDDLYPFIEK